MVELVASNPPPEMEERVLRLRADVLSLKATMTASHVRSAFLILERVRDDLSEVLERGKFEQ